MSKIEQAKNRSLSAEEFKWINDAKTEIECCNWAISGLADMLIPISEMMKDERIPIHYRQELCEKGAESLAYGIKELCLRVADRNEYIRDTLKGIVAAEMQGRREAVHRMHGLM